MNQYTKLFVVVPPSMVRKAKKFYGKSVTVIAAKKIPLD
jgi:hypothetical protein